MSLSHKPHGHTQLRRQLISLSEINTAQIVRGDVTKKTLALIFTGDEKGESTAPILDALRDRKIRAGFFVTGSFVRDAKLAHC